MRSWLIPTAYFTGATTCGLGFPRIEQRYLASYTFDLSVASAQAFFSSVASGMIALTAIVFAIGMVMVQFGASAYSPRLAVWYSRDRILFHSLGVFIATFTYALATLAWVDRRGSGTVPLFSGGVVLILLIASMLLFSLLVQRINDLQITNVLQKIGDMGREVIRGMFARLDEAKNDRPAAFKLGELTQTLHYTGEPRAIAKLDVDGLTRQAEAAGAIIVMECAVGDTLVENTLLLRVHGARQPLSRAELMRTISLKTERTFEQDPKLPLRLLVDIAIRALSPAINDPTTAVQAIDQIEDLLVRLGRRELDAGIATDKNGQVRLVQPMPAWEDYLALAFDEIRHYGAGSVQVMRRLRSALTGLSQMLEESDRAEPVRRYLKHLDSMIERSPLHGDDRDMARREDRQGLGLTRRRTE